MQPSQDTISRTEKSEASSYAKINSAMLLSFINRLLSAVKGIDGELNAQVSKLKTALDRTTSDDDIIAQIKNVERQLMLHPGILSDSVKLGDSATIQAAKSLAGLLNDDTELTEELRLLIAEPKASAINELQTRVKSLFYIYNRAVKNLKHGANGNDSMTASMHNKICDDLQRLINELDFVGGFVGCWLSGPDDRPCS